MWLINPRIHSAARREPSGELRSNTHGRSSQAGTQAGRAACSTRPRNASAPSIKKIVARVEILGQCEHSQIQVASQEELQCSISRLLPRGVGVVNQHHSLGQSSQRSKMIFTQRRSQRAHEIRQAQPGEQQ